MSEETMKFGDMSASLKLRYVIYRLLSLAVIVAGAMFVVKGYYSSFLISVGTVVLIIGVALWMMASPGSYNSSTDMVQMIAMDRPRKIEEFYEAYKDVPTPLGSCYLANFRTMRRPALAFDPNSEGDYLYFWLTGDGNLGYIGYSFLTSMIKKRITEPLHPLNEDFGTNAAAYICYHSDIMLMQKGLQKSMEHFVKTGEVLPVVEARPSKVYTFTEDFKLMGQRFDLQDEDGELIYHIEGTMPLKQFYIYDAQDTEIFRIEKRILHALPTYDFYYRGEEYGRLEKKFQLIRDTFTMNVKEGKLVLREYAGSLGHNFFVILNDRMLGSIMENLEFTLKNVVFDNSVVICYEEQYLPLLTAMAIMVAREIARDDEKENS